ncbi:uncharacterized protein LOC132901871 [Amyelois transitella]|uniref:uncharacterized protein LOC132901871 n=1 Tax=Amyelois transitella TaxID=680683 RepID=UPI00298FFF4F|nr:uncharacterized protein LOC132901871 [Amyelois transitella]
MKFLIIFVLVLALAGASIFLNKSRYQYTIIVVDDLGDNQANTLDNLITATGVVALESCANGLCDFLCKLYGWLHGRCISGSECQCYN